MKRATLTINDVSSIMNNYDHTRRYRIKQSDLRCIRLIYGVPSFIYPRNEIGMGSLDG